MPKTDESNERHIKALTEIRNKLHSAAGSLCCYDDLHKKYGTGLNDLVKELEAILGRCLLRRHDDENPPHLQK
jgi:hypothetical protein